MNASDLGYVCALVLALVFARAGLSKLGVRAALRHDFARMGVPFADRVAVAVPYVELTVATLLIVAPVVGSTSALVVLAAFSIILAIAIARGTNVPCHCFGQAHERISALDLVRNAILAGLAILATAGEPAEPRLASLVLVALMLFAGVLLFRVGRGLPQTRSPKHA